MAPCPRPQQPAGRRVAFCSCEISAATSGVSCQTLKVTSKGVGQPRCCWEPGAGLPAGTAAVGEAGAGVVLGVAGEDGVLGAAEPPVAAGRDASNEAG